MSSAAYCPAADAELAELMAGLRREFIAEGHGECLRLLCSASAALDLHEARVLAHRWSGMAGTVGLERIGSASRALDRMLACGGASETVVLRRLCDLASMFERAARE